MSPEEIAEALALLAAYALIPKTDEGPPPPVTVLLRIGHDQNGEETLKYEVRVTPNVRSAPARHHFAKVPALAEILRAGAGLEFDPY